MSEHEQLLILGVAGHALAGFFYGLATHASVTLLMMRWERPKDGWNIPVLMGWLLLFVASILFWNFPFAIGPQVVFFVRTWPEFSELALLEMGAAVLGFAVGFFSGVSSFFAAYRAAQPGETRAWMA